MAIRELKEQIGRLPEQPGVYLYFNAAGDTIYVGNPTIQNMTNRYPPGTILNGGKVRSIEASGGPTWLPKLPSSSKMRT